MFLCASVLIDNKRIFLDSIPVPTLYLSEIAGLIKEKFGVSYSFRQVSRILRSFGMHYSKPYPENYRKPENAKGILKERLTDALKNKKGQCVIGFFDEASPQTTDNKQKILVI